MDDAFQVLQEEGLENLGFADEKGGPTSVCKTFAHLQKYSQYRLKQFQRYDVSNFIISDKVYFCSFIESHLTKLFTLHYLQKIIIYPFLIFPVLP